MKRLLAFFTVALAIGVLAGCSNDDPVSTTQDPDDQLYGAAQTDMQYFEMFADNSDYSRTDDATMNDGDTPESIDDLDMPKLMTGVYPLRWARFIRNVSRTVVLDSVTVDSMAYVTVTKTWDGSFLIAAAYSDTATAPDTVIHKPFTSRATKRFVFRRIANSRVIWRNWRRVAVSLVDGGTTSSTAIDITELKLRFDRAGVADSLVITDPNTTFLRFPRITDLGGARDIPDVPGGHPVTMQVTLRSADPDTDMVALRFGYSLDRRHRHRIRFRLVSETFDGSAYTRVYQRTFQMHFRMGVFSAAVDAMTHATLFDDAAPVSTSFWGVPYVVTQ